MTTGSSVNATSHHTILSSNESSWKSLETPFLLGPLDQLVASFTPVTAVFLYQQSEGTEVIPIARLHTAFSRLLDYYPHLSGRLQINPVDASIEIASFGTGAELVFAQSTESLHSFTSTESEISVSLLKLPGAGNDLLAPSNSSQFAGAPLFTIQHTRFACGGVGLGVTAIHLIADAYGFFRIVQDLAELYQAGTTTLAQPPQFRPLIPRTSGDLSPSDFKPCILFVDTPKPDVSEPLSALETRLSRNPSPVQGRYLHFSRRELASLKSAATDPSPSSSSDWVSTFDALCAQLHQRIYLARLKTGVKLSPPDFLTPVNVRSILNLPSTYIPNAILNAYTSFLVHSLASASLWEIAKRIHKISRTRSFTSKEGIIETLKWISAQPDKSKIRNGFRFGEWRIVDNPVAQDRLLFKCCF